MSLRKFEILEMIAKGGMAEVFRARTVGLEGFAKEVCVKKILPHLTQDESFITMFIDEAKLAATLNYANIVQVHDLCVSADRDYFIVMEYVDGKDLSDVIRAAQLAGREIPPDIVAYIGREVCKGLYYAHTKTDVDGHPLSIIHRDISPQNILLSFLGEVKITDFGIAKASSSVNKTAVGILKGKYGYMSPEQARGEPLDARSDLFNLGILLYELLVGERCFAGASDYSTLNLMREALVTPPREINKSVPKRLEDIVLKALKRSPSDRYQDALELEGALADWARSEGREARDSDAMRFMQELFKNREAKQDETTGVIQLSSVVGPAPAEEPKKKEKKKSEPPPKPKPAAPSASAAPPSSERKSSPAPRPDEPGSEALARAKRRKARSEESEKKAPASAEEKHSEAPPPKKATQGRKIARLKPQTSAEAKKAAKKKQKKEAAANRKPVGRRELRPEFTRLRKLGKTNKSWPRAMLIVIVASAGGVVWGLNETRVSSQQKIFRDMELADLEPKAADAKNTAYILIESSPPGANVWLDGNKLADRTPLMVERPMTDKTHTCRLEKANFESLEAEFTLDHTAPMTIVKKELKGIPGELVIWSKPSGLPAKLDGKEVGSTPLSLDVPAGPHEVEIGGDQRIVVKDTIDVRAGEKTTFNPTVPEKGRETLLKLETSPAAYVLVDGKTRGLTNRDPVILEPGVRHKITLQDDQKRKKREFWVELKAGEERRIFLDLHEAS